MTLYFSCFIVLSLVLSTSVIPRLPPDPNAKFVPPILWKPTNNIAATGFNFKTHAAVLISPCAPLRLVWKNQLKKEKDRTSLTYLFKTNWLICDKLYREKVLGSIHKNCDSINNLQHLEWDTPNSGTAAFYSDHRRKRQLEFLAGLHVDGLVTFGVLSVEHFAQEKVNARNIDHINKEMEKNVNSIKHRNLMTDEIEHKLALSLNRTWAKMGHFDDELNDAASSDRLLTAAMITIEDTANNLDLLFRGFEMNKVDPAYGYLFPGANIKENSRTYYWTAHTCKVFGEDTLIMGFDIPRVHKDVQIMKADTFRIVTTNKKGQTCLDEFNGNKFVYWNKANNCTKDILNPPENEDTAIPIRVSDELCGELQNRTFSWKATRCGDFFTRDQYFSLKQDDQHFYIYCFNHTLRLGTGNSFRCPNAVLKFSKHLTFYVNHKKYPIVHRGMATRFDMSFSVSELINNSTFFPDDHHLENLGNLNSVLRKIDAFKANNKTLIWYPRLLTHSSFLTLIGFVIAIFAFGILFCCLNRTYHQQKRKLIRQKQLKQQI